ncbi:MAG: MBL fold metallo-hydrolase [Patescibacteria group bacterium]
MIIHWYGHSCFKIQSSLNDSILAIDPYDTSLGWRSPRIAADIGIISTQRGEYNNSESFKPTHDTQPFIIQYPGEYEIGGVFVHTLPIDQKTLVSALRIDECSLVHLGAVNRALTEQELEELGNVDVLMIPVGGHIVLDAKKAVALINEIEPRIVIPMQYKTANSKSEMDSIEVFLKEYGVKDVEAIDKLKLAKKDLPADKTEIVLLNLA